MTNQNPPKPVVLCILDGWGHREESDNNAIAMGDTPTWDRWMSNNPTAMIETAGQHVGLPDGQMGNSEVGHMNIGSGRVVMQDLPKIDASIRDGSLADIENLNIFCDMLKNSGGTCHLMGLLSTGGVHSHMYHMVALARIIAGEGVPVRIHAFLDGRDTPPKSASGYVEQFLSHLGDLDGDAKLVTLAGRYYAMDRDKNWDRVEQAYQVLVSPAPEGASDSALSVIKESYDADITDEFVKPTALAGHTGMAKGDGVLMANFRADRARQICDALLSPKFKGFKRLVPINFTAAIGMTSYSDDLDEFMDALFPAENLPDTLGEVLGKQGYRQLRIAETEKYAHVTFFLNGGREQPFDGEDRILVPSPKVATYDLQPAMSAVEVTDKIIATILDGRHDVIIVNYANGDMVGHTGVLDAAIAAAGVIDKCLERVEKALIARRGAMIVTADHGNCELMADPETGGPHTAHTIGAVASVLVGAPADIRGFADGRLCDLAPTLLDLLGIDQPEAMTGSSLLSRDGVADRAAQ